MSMMWWESLSGASRALLIMSFSGSMVSILLFTIKPIIRNRLLKSAQYYLWLIVIAAYLVPFSTFVTIPYNDIPSIGAFVHETVVSGYEYQEREMLKRTGHTGQLSDEQITQMNGDELARTVSIVAETERTKDILNFIMLQLPIIGMISVLSVVSIEYMRFIRKLKKRSFAASEKETAMLTDLFASKRIPLLYRNPLAATPMLFGVFRPAIILPDREYTNEQLRAVLLHELTHLRRKDILVKWLSVLVCATHWFNPVAWVVRREVDRACELACDEAVIRKIGEDGKQNYGETLLYVAADSKTPHAVLSTTMCEEKKALKERLGAIMKSKKHTRLAIIVSVALIVAVGGAAIALGAGSSEPLIEMKMVYEDNPAYVLQDMKLVWDDSVYYVTHIDNAKPGKEIGYATDEYSTWRVYELKGHGRDYIYAVESEDVWRVMSIYPPEQPWRQYILENATDRERLTKMLSVRMYNDGTVRLATPLISSYFMDGTYYYSFAEGELLISHENGMDTARFEVVDDDTIIFRSATFPLFADEGARYVSVPISEVTYKHPVTVTNGGKPFKDLKADDISVVEIKLSPPGRSVSVYNRESIEEIIIALQNVVTYEKDDTAGEYSGQLVLYTLMTAKGGIIEIGAYNPFISVNGQYYKVKYEPCEELNAIGNTLFGTAYSRQKVQTHYIQLSAMPARYTPLISSSPGMKIEILYGEPYTTVRYHATTGTFVTWSGDIVTDLGNNIVTSNDTPIYWSPTPTQDIFIIGDEAINVAILRRAEQSAASIVAEVAVSLLKDDEGYYSIGETMKSAAPIDAKILTHDILDKIYLGMSKAELHDLLGEPDYMGSGMDFDGYNGIGSFYFSDSYSNSVPIATPILLEDRQWSIDELINEAVIQHNDGMFYEPTGVYPTESHVILAIDANIHGFTAYIMSLYRTFLPDGDYNVREVAGQHLPLALSFIKTQNGNYTLSEYWEAENGSRYTPSIYAKFPQNTWDKTSTQLYIEAQNRNCYVNAMYFFVGAIPSSLGFSIGEVSVFITDYAEYQTLDGEFLIKYFPGATLSIEAYAEVREIKPSGWIIEYSDSSKNIAIGKNYMAAIPISDDMIGIFNPEDGKYSMRFEKYIKQE